MSVPAPPAERFRRLGELFEVAVGMSPEQQAAFIQQACGTDLEMIAELEALLRADASAPTLAGAVGDEARQLVEALPRGGPRLAPGARLGRYEILAPLGAGGMGEVWRARDGRLGREVAIKVLPRQLTADAAALARFEREARAVAALSHPNILDIHELAREGDTLYAVTELLPGKTLRDLLLDGALPRRRAREWCAQLARALAAAHDAGIVHRDVKPENVIVSDAGVVKLLDFGIARQGQPLDRSASDPARTVTGFLVGTVGYMAPEQVRGEVADSRADLFALGCVLYELVTGERAFHRASAVETLHAILVDEPAKLDELAEGSPELARIVRRCLEKDREDRFQNAHDLAFVLAPAPMASASVAELAPINGSPAPPAATPQPAGRAVRWRRALLLVAAGAAAALLLLLSARRWGAPQSAPKLRTLSSSGQDWGAAVSPDGRILAFVSQRDGRPRIWLRTLSSGEEAALTSGPDEAPRFSPDGSSLLFARHQAGGKSALFRVGLLGGEPRLVVPGASAGDWAPDGRRVCFVRRREGKPGSALGVAGADGSDERIVLVRDGVRPLVTPRWSPREERIAVVRSGALPGLPDELWLVDVDGGEGRQVQTPAGGPISAPVWLRGGRALLYAQAEQVSMFNPASRLVVQSTRGGAPRVLLSYPQHTRAVDLLGDGRVVLDVVSRRARLREVAIGGERTAPGPGPFAGGSGSPGRWLTRGDLIDRQPVYSPDGRWVVFSSSRSGNLDLWAVERTTGALRRLTDDPATDWDPAFSADGRQLLWSSNRGGHFEVWIADAEGQGARQLSHDGFGAENPTATPDGWVVYGGGTEEQGGIWKLRLGGGGATRVLRRDLVNHPDVSPDGRVVAYHVTVPGGVEVSLVDLGSGRRLGAPLLLDDSAAARGTVLGVNPTSIGRLRWQRDGSALLVLTVDEAGRTGVSVAPRRDDGTLDGTLRPLAGFVDELQPESFGVAPDGSALTLSVPDFTMALMAIEGLEGIARPGDEPR